MSNFMYIFLYFRRIFWGGPLPYWRILGGVCFIRHKFGGGGTAHRVKNWGGSAFTGRRPENWHRPPLGMFLGPSLRVYSLSLLILFYFIQIVWYFNHTLFYSHIINKSIHYDDFFASLKRYGMYYSTMGHIKLHCLTQFIQDLENCKWNALRVHS